MTFHPSYWIHSVLEHGKWPITAFLLASLWHLPAQLWVSVQRLLTRHQQGLTYLIAGLVIYGVVTFLLLKIRHKGAQTLSVLMVLEHEIAHAVVGVMTGNHIHAINAHASEGGRVTLEGQPNWLLTLAPYFVPLPLLVAWPLIALTIPSARDPILFVTGILLAFHMHSTARETQLQQPDLVKVGRFFACVFLPLAHLWMLLWFSCVLTGRFEPLQTVWIRTWRVPLQWLTHLMETCCR